MRRATIMGHPTVKDAGKWSAYRLQVPATLKPWGAELVCRGKLAAILAGGHAHTDTVVIRFPDMQAVNGWYTSAACQSLIPLRTEAAEWVLPAYEG